MPQVRPAEGCTASHTQAALRPRTEKRSHPTSVEHSLLPPDDGDLLKRIDINVLGLSDYNSRMGLKQIDFLKRKAEGLEPELNEGLYDMRPRKLAIDISPECAGASPEPSFEDIIY